MTESRPENTAAFLKLLVNQRDCPGCRAEVQVDAGAAVVQHISGVGLDLIEHLLAEPQPGVRARLLDHPLQRSVRQPGLQMTAPYVAVVATVG